MLDGRPKRSGLVLGNHTVAVKLGLAYLNLWGAQPDIKRNRLVRVLEEWTPPFEGLCLYYPGRRHLPAPLRALVNLVKEIRNRELGEE